MPNAAMDDFDAKLARAGMRGQWKSEQFLHAAIGGPKPAGAPALWRWDDVTAFLNEAGRVMPESLQARRSLIFQNSGIPRGTTHTMNMGVQMILPGETAWAHRHSIAALRFVIAGNAEVYTVVNGETCPMQPFDLILTPNWSWHDHHNTSAETACWLDVLDVPLVLGLNQTFYEPGTGEKQLGVAAPHGDASSHVRFPWSEVAPLLAAAPCDDHDGRVYTYPLPKQGASAFPTLSCQVQALPPGFATPPRRRTSSAVYFVMEGEGTTEVADQSLQWSKNDCFAIPNWCWHRHVNRSDREVLFFSVHDTPTIRALGLYREERQDTATDTSFAPSLSAADAP